MREATGSRTTRRNVVAHHAWWVAPQLVRCVWLVTMVVSCLLILARPTTSFSLVSSLSCHRPAAVLCLSQRKQQSRTYLAVSETTVNNNNNDESSSTAVLTNSSQTDTVEFTNLDNNNNIDIDDNDDDDDEYDYIEYDQITEAELVNSEWLIGTNWDNSNSIQETWLRLTVDPRGKNVAVWGNTNAKGTWALDVASQFLSASQETLWGKRIWACTIQDYYYLQGTVRGWTYWSAASVLGQFQARRLGVDRAEAGTPPWFGENEGYGEEQQ